MKDIKQSKAMEITFDKFELKTPNGEVKGKGKLTDLSNPRLRLSCTGKSRLEELIKVAEIQEEIEGSGAISWTLDFEGPLGKEFQTTVKELKQMRWSGVVNLANTNLKFQDGIPQIKEFSAQIEMKLDKTVVKDCKGKIGHIEFTGEVEVARLKELLTNSSTPLNLTGTINIKDLDVSKLPTEWQFTSSETDAGTSSRPTTINLSSTIEKVAYNDFTATNVAGFINMENDVLNISNLKFNALDGQVSTNLSFRPNTAGFVLEMNPTLRNINMSRALSEWNNFGQTTITSSALKGKASATLLTTVYLDKEYQVLMDKLEVETDIEISGGQLIDFEPLMAMSRFISVDELQDVKFDTLRNQLSIRDSKLFIPKMSISSSILNVQVFGEHAFDQEMDYHVNLLLNDLLRRKVKKTQTFDGHEIVDNKGKTRLFLWVRGKPGDLKVGFDKREVRKKLKDDFKKEGQTIKQLFKDEFSGSSSQEEETEEVQFRLEEDENTPIKDNNKSEEETVEPEKKKKKKKKKKGLFSSEPDEEETEGGFEIEFEP